jgi:hypothetical protein
VGALARSGPSWSRPAADSSELRLGARSHHQLLVHVADLAEHAIHVDADELAAPLERPTGHEHRVHVARVLTEPPTGRSRPRGGQREPGGCLEPQLELKARQPGAH